MADTPEALRAGVLGDLPHGFMTRRGGLSQGAVAGLNCGLGSGDDPAVVAVNRRLAGDAVLPGAPVVGVFQTHSALCVTLDEPWSDDARPEADALVTDRRGVLLAIVTADCAPILLADREAGVVGAAHAGWKGALGGVIEATVAAMEAIGARPDRIDAAIGPCIAQQSYEVDDAFRERFLANDAIAHVHFAGGSAGHWQFDLPGYVAARLHTRGISRVESVERDTYADADRFYSFRRAMHLGEATYGRLVSLIGMAP